MTKNEFINKVIQKFELTNVDVDKISGQLDAYKEYLQAQNKITNLTRLDKDDII